ncbi:NADH dehydrogenase [ubiquinone] iron-sulfur protein 6, mitochondrial [Diospyros lotus]|uniref:NADH dehydrogenase [ubiquinone] iron-sulfur protein 6, mitochondrial n=1 Tax=Diospyros lotus TaxID=55363 RepID=UPI002254BFA2|nr:NADH dehydrogenase [ubiquinone] iron-sulfur protein 6, mitochondrial [Diospyros lotus]
MAASGRKMGYSVASNLIKTLTRSSNPAPSSFRSLSGAVVSDEVITSHTAKWMQDTSKKSPMELINEVPPIKVEGRIAACEGDTNPALGHPIEFICLDRDEPAICKYCGLRYVQDHGHHHH